MEELLVKSLENWIRSIKMGTKKPADIGLDVSKAFNRLKPLNLPMYEDLMDRYKTVVNENKNK